MADVLEDESEQTVSIQEYLKDVEEQELEADLVLGGDEGKECTYTKGYMKRQTIFSDREGGLTCTPYGNKRVCTACNLSCHDGHKVIDPRDRIDANLIDFNQSWKLRSTMFSWTSFSPQDESEFVSSIVAKIWLSSL